MLVLVSASSGRDLTEEKRESGFYDDVYQLKCIPAPDVCPEDFGNNEDATCFPLDENGD